MIGIYSALPAWQSAASAEQEAGVLEGGEREGQQKGPPVLLKPTVQTQNGRLYVFNGGKIRKKHPFIGQER